MNPPTERRPSLFSHPRVHCEKLGPDGFGDTPEEEQARIDMLVTLCRDYDFGMFKFDAVAGQLRPEKQGAFARAIRACWEYSTDLLVLTSA